jgi:hypothetical protein
MLILPDRMLVLPDEDARPAGQDAARCMLGAVARTLAS